MLKTVLRHASVVRLRPASALLWNAPCGCYSSAESWRDAAALVTQPSHAFSRCFSVATTNETTLEAVDSIKDDNITFEEPPPATKKKKKRTKKSNKRNRPPSEETARKLFDEMAPHMPLKTLSAITRKLKRSTPKLPEKETKIGQVHALLETAEIPPWAQQRFTEFFLKQPFATLKDEDPVQVNKESFDANVKILMQARDLSAQKPMLWSIAQRRKLAQNKKAAAAAASDDDESVEGSINDDVNNDNESTEERDLLTIHQSKSETQCRKEAEELLSLLAECLPEKSFQALMQLLGTYVQQTTNPKKPKLRMLFSHLSKCVSTHIHFVAQQVATFLYVHHSTTADPRVVRREKEWKARQDEFCESVLQIYNSLENIDMQQYQKSRGLKGKNAAMLGELDKLRTRPSDGVKVGRDRQQEQARHGRRRKNVHLVFDAMLLQDEWNVPTPRQYIVFVDNLPIDMEETDLFDLYSRCGPVQSVQIFNQRPELDPGPLAAKERREKKVNQRMSSNRRRWKRPRTPVYAQITFVTQQAYETAIDAPLRIFGMVVRKHPMRSIRTEDMTSLFLEDIPQGMYSLDIEHKLSQLLHPEIYVGLNIGQHDFAEAASCEIKFPSFEMAHYAYHKLQELDIEGSSLQWMRTPEDAMQYWIREYSFET